MSHFNQYVMREQVYGLVPSLMQDNAIPNEGRIKLVLQIIAFGFAFTSCTTALVLLA